MTPELVPLIVFLAIGLVVVAALMFVRDIRSARQRAAQSRLPENGEQSTPELELAVTQSNVPPRGPLDRFDRWFGGMVADTGLNFSPQAALLLAVMVGLAVGGGLFLWREDLLATSAGFVAGILATTGFFAYQRSRRRRLLQEQLPTTMDLLARSTRAGQSLDQAIELAGEMSAEPLAAEFRRCARQIEMGLSLDASIRAMSRRVPMQETRVFAATLMVQRRAGGSLPLTLERLAAVFRDRIAYERQFRAATASGRGSAIVIVAMGLLAAGYMLIAQPEYAQNFLNTFVGQVTLATAVGLFVVGMFWIWRLLRPNF